MMTAIQQLNDAARLIAPEIVLIATVCVMFLVGPFLVGPAGQATAGLRHRWGGLALAALGTAWLIWFNSDVVNLAGGPFLADGLTWFARGLSLTLGSLLVLLLWNQIDDGHAAEAHACLLSIVAGTNLVAAANDLVELFLALELVSIPTYVLLYIVRRDRSTREATVKYFLLSVFSSALVLYGMAWLYGSTGTTNLTGIAQALSLPDQGEGVMRHLALVLLVAGLAFRITAVPFHFYAPDVFQGVATSNAAMLSFIPKLVGFVALVRLLPLTGATITTRLWLPDESARLLLAILAVATMFVGNLMALRQKHLFRLLAYSSIAHAGYMLVGLAVGDVGVAVGGTSALLFYLAAYGLMTLGVFALLRGASSGAHPLETIDDLRGLSSTHSTTALLLAVCLFSLTGLPPTAGFLGKLNLFLAAWGETTAVGHWLAGLMAVNAAIAAFYYLRLVAVMYLEPAAECHVRQIDVASWLGGLACTVATLVLFVQPQWLWDAVARATG